jgi:NADP-dependent 3-hydroxy acid dehydrogenase YdfG
MSETQRVAIVTGAAGGIGSAMTRALLSADIRVAGVDRDHDPLETLAASAREQGKAAELLTVCTDLSNDSAAEEHQSHPRSFRPHRYPGEQCRDRPRFNPAR